MTFSEFLKNDFIELTDKKSEILEEILNYSHNNPEPWKIVRQKQTNLKIFKSLQVY